MHRLLIVFVSSVLFLTADVHAAKKPCTSGCRTPRRVTEVWVPKPGEVKKHVPAPARCAVPCPTEIPCPPQTTTVWQAVPTVVNVNHVQTVMTTQWQMQQQARTVMQPVARTVLTPVTVPVQSLETRIGIQQVVQNVPVQVQRPVTTSCVCTQQVAGCAPTVTACQPATRYVTTIENRPQVVNQQISYQVPVTRYTTQYQQRQVVDYRPVQQVVNVPVAVQVPVQQVQTVPTLQYQYVATQVPVAR